MTEAEKERAAVVAWLRREMHWSGGEDLTMAYVAQCIARGEHLKAKDKINSEALAELIAMDADMIAAAEGRV